MGIINRDIKPDNVLYDNLGKNYLLADWGLSEIFLKGQYASK